MRVHTIGRLEFWLDLAAREAPEAPALITEAGTLTYAQLAARADAAAAALAARGVAVGDRVATTLPPGQDFAALMHALPKLGAVLVPLNTRLTERERAQVLERARATLVVDEPLPAPDGGAAAPTRREADIEEPFAVIFTSGTTGEPKPVELTHGNFMMSALGSAANLGVEPDDRWLCVMPLFHVGGLSILVRSAIYRTAAIVHPGFDAEAARRSIESGEATLVSLVATQLRRLLDAGLSRAPALRAALIGGGPVPADLLERAQAAGIPVVPTYGMTETCSQVWTGRPLMNAEIVTSGDGELLVRGPMVALGEIADDGWLHTGDRGRIDPDGTLHVEGRIADTIVSGGENVAAAEVEAALLAHPAIEDAAVVGREDPEWGQAVTAFVVLRGPAPDLDEHLRGRLAAFKVPKAIHEIDAIPRNAAGKIVRAALP
jgi:O-succinylbenzoic acid--CoA ligase